MVISKDVWTLVESESSSFRAMNLSDCTVVVNGFDFMHTVLHTYNVDCKYGGEYSKMAVLFEEVLRKFLQCNLKPIFVFGGCTQFTEGTLSNRIHRLHRQLNLLSSFINRLNEPAQGVYFTYLPIFVKETLVGVLNDLNISHVTCDTDANPACVSLGAQLKCPVIADSPDFLLHEFQDMSLGSDGLGLNSNLFVFIPFRFLSFEPLPIMSLSSSASAAYTNPKYSLIGHVFCPSASSIHKLPYHMRPFLPIYLHPPGAGPTFSLPKHLLSKHKEGGSQVDEARLRVQNVIKWLLQLETPWNVLEETVLKFPERVAQRFIHQLIFFTKALKIDSAVGANLLAFIKGEPKVKAEDDRQSSVDLLSWLQFQPKNSQPDAVQKEVLSLIAQMADTDSDSELLSFLSHVPPSFLHLYRSGFVSPVMFARIFSHSWVLMPVVEDLSKPSVTDCGVGMRFLQYSLCLGFAIQCNQIDETKPGVVIEVNRIPPMNMCLRTIQLCPFFLPLTKDPTAVCHAFLRQQLGYIHPADDTSLDWFPSFALTLALWHVHQDAKQVGEALDLFSYPTLLSVALCTCVMACGGVRDPQTVDAHFNKLADDFEPQPPLNIALVHELNQLQNILMSLLSLVRMLDVIMITSGSSNFAQTPTQSYTVLHCPPTWVVFACSRLLHLMSHEFAALQSNEDRQRAAREIWLPRLIPDGNEDVAEVGSKFSRLVDLVCSISKTVHPVNFHYQLDPIEPPPALQSVRPQFNNVRGAYRGNAARNPRQPRGQQNGSRYSLPSPHGDMQSVNGYDQPNQLHSGRYSEPKQQRVYNQWFERGGETGRINNQNVNRRPYNRGGNDLFENASRSSYNYSPNVQSVPVDQQPIETNNDNSTNELSTWEQRSLNQPSTASQCSRSKTVSNARVSDDQSLPYLARHSFPASEYGLETRNEPYRPSLPRNKDTSDDVRADARYSTRFASSSTVVNQPIFGAGQQTQPEVAESIFKQLVASNIQSDIPKYQRQNPQLNALSRQQMQKAESVSEQPIADFIQSNIPKYQHQTPPFCAYNRQLTGSDLEQQNNCNLTFPGYEHQNPQFRRSYTNTRSSYNANNGNSLRYQRGNGEQHSRQSMNRGNRGRGRYLQRQQEANSTWSMYAIHEAVEKVKSLF